MDKQEYEETVATYHDYLEKMSSATKHFCEDLEASNYQEISGVLPAIIDGLGWLNEAISGFVNLGKIDENKYQSFQNVVGSLNEALENKDYILLHDILEYEFLPLLGELKVENLYIS